MLAAELVDTRHDERLRRERRRPKAEPASVAAVEPRQPEPGMAALEARLQAAVGDVNAEDFDRDQHVVAVVEMLAACGVLARREQEGFHVE